MAIKYIVIPEKKTVKAFLEHTEYDAYNKISKMLRDTPFCACSDKYLMPKNFKVILVCDKRDEFDENWGKNRARKILLDNYYKSLDKKMAKFKEDMLVLNGKVFETPKELENNA